MIDNPEIPEPERAPSPEDKPLDQPVGEPAGQPRMNGNGGGHPQVTVDNEALIAWMKATDKELKMMKVTQLILCGAVLLLLVTNAKSLGLPKAP